MRDQLETHLRILNRQGLIESWHDRKIDAGDEWKQHIDTNLKQADIIRLLVSPDFLASNDRYDFEMTRAMECHVASEAQVIPVIVRTVNWHMASFLNYKPYRRDGKPVTSWTDQGAAWSSVSAGIEDAVQRQMSDVKGAEPAKSEIQYSRGRANQLYLGISCPPIAEKLIGDDWISILKLDY